MIKYLQDIFKYYIQTFQNIVKNSSILTTMILSVFFYSFFYPIAYQAQTAEDLPIIIVDEEQSVTSNAFISQVAKSPNIKITEITTNFEYAKLMIQNQKADGILLLPDHLSDSIARGEAGGIGLYLSSAYFLRTKQIGIGLATAIEQTAAEQFEKFGKVSHFNFVLPIFVSCTIALAMVLASYLDISERAGHLIVFTSIPLFLLSGTAWPLSAMPIWMQYFSNLLPSTQGINLFIQLNQMGVPIQFIIPKLIFLLTTTGIFIVWAFYRLISMHKN